jgi:hypothetical protein
MPRILIACEFSGIVREAFRANGIDAYSCDILESEILSPYHIKSDLRDLLHKDRDWEGIIAFPSCQRLCVSGARWFSKFKTEQEDALQFVRFIMNFPCKKIALENPIGVISTRIRKPDQIIQPWQFGHGETKATCLWLKNLPPLKPTKIVPGRKPRIHLEPPGKDRWKNRSRTFPGIAQAMAEQWSNLF